MKLSDIIYLTFAISTIGLLLFLATDMILKEEVGINKTSCDQEIYCSCPDIKTVPHDFIGPLQKGTVREAKK